MIEPKLLQMLLPEQFKREFLRDVFGMDEATVKQRVDQATEIYQVVTFGMEDDRMALLRRLHYISVTETSSGVTATHAWHKVLAKMGERTETATGTFAIDPTDPMSVVNAPKAAETNAKNRVTLSLIGYGFKGLKEVLDVTPSTPAAEPARPDAPAVNNAPASPAEDVRYEHKNVYPQEADPRTVDNVLNLDKTAPVVHVHHHHQSGLATPITEIVPENPNVERIQTTLIPSFPKVSEEQVAALHNESSKLNAPSRDPANDSPKQAVEAPAEQQSIFGAAEAEPIDPNANASAILGSTKVAEETKSSVPSTTSITPAGTDAATGQTSDQALTPSVEQLGTGPGQTDVADIPAITPFTDKPTQLQFREFNKRCMGITRDGLKGIKDGGPALLAYLKKRFGTSQLETANVLLWESTLQELEAFKEPQKLFQHLKGGK